MALLTEHLQAALGCISSTPKPGCVGHTCNSSTLEMEAEGAAVQNNPWPPIEFEANLGYMEPEVEAKSLMFILA